MENDDKKKLIFSRKKCYRFETIINKLSFPLLEQQKFESVWLGYIIIRCTSCILNIFFIV